MNTEKIVYQNCRKLIDTINSAKYLLLIFSLIAALNVAFLYTYPLNVAAYDNPNYLSMMVAKASNLMHASGYPYIMMLGSKLFGIIAPATIFGEDWNVIGSDWYSKLQNLQLLIHLLLMFVGMGLCAKSFGKLTAAIMLLFWGGSVLFMSSVGSAAPEWLQGDVLLLSMLICSTAYFSKSKYSKITLYGIGFMVMTVAYLIKYNSLVFYPVIILLILIDTKEAAWKIFTMLLSLILSIAIVSVFINSFHFPTTQSKKLNFDHAWVLTNSMPGNYFRAPLNSMGIHALRWRALNAVLPPEYFRAAAFCCISSGASSEEKGAYRVEYEKIMTASKEELTEYISAHETRKEFDNFTSSIPLYWYIGLEETDKLGIQVFKESIFRIPGFYISKIWNGALDASMIKQQIVPFRTETLGLKLSDADGKDSSFLRVETAVNTRGTTYLYWNPSELLWRPGVLFFEKVNNVTKHRFLEILIVLFSIFGIFSNKDRRARAIQYVYLISILVFSAASFTLAMRHKEMISIFPIAAAFIAMGFTSISTYFLGLFRIQHI